MKENFKVGDRVKYTCSSSSTSHIDRIYHGKKGTILPSEDNNAHQAYVQFKDGNAYFFSTCQLTLIKPKSPKKTYWVNVYKDSTSIGFSFCIGYNVYNSKKEAKANTSGKAYVKTVKIKL